MQITGIDQANTVVAISQATEVRGRGGFLGLNRTALTADSLLNGLPVTIDLAEPLGSETVLHGRLADGTELTARIPGGMPGEGLRLAPDLAALHIFDATSGKRLDPA